MKNPDFLDVIKNLRSFRIVYLCCILSPHLVLLLCEMTLVLPQLIVHIVTPAARSACTAVVAPDTAAAAGGGGTPADFALRIS